MKNALNRLSGAVIINFFVIVLMISVYNKSFDKPTGSRILTSGIKSQTNIITAKQDDAQFNKQSSTPDSTSDEQAAPPTEAPQQIDLFSQVSAHASKNDCWVTYQGNVYDVTSYFGSHPGGDDVIVKYCGGDISGAFSSKEKDPPQDHSANAKSLLQQYLIQ